MSLRTPRRYSGMCVALVALCVLPLGCRKKAATRAAKKPTVASLVPAATDLIEAMGAGDHLVGVSKQGRALEGTEQLPRVGDYLTVDWEKLAEVQPDVLVVQMTPEKMPAGLQQRAADLHIQLLNVRIDRLADVFTTLAQLGDTLREKDKAAALDGRLKGQLDAVRRRVMGEPKVPTLLTVSESVQAVAGRETFLDDVLGIAGGQNVAKAKGYLTLDPERIEAMRPKAILLVLAEASPQQKAEAERAWKNLGDVPAVKAGHCWIFDEWYAMQPGSHLGDLAEAFAERLHPNAAPGGGPITQPKAAP